MRLLDYVVEKHGCPVKALVVKAAHADSNTTLSNEGLKLRISNSDSSEEYLAPYRHIIFFWDIVLHS